MSITYQETTAGIGPNDLEGFFVGWPNRPSPEAHLRILEGSDHVSPGGRSEPGRCRLRHRQMTPDAMNSASATVIQENRWKASQPPQCATTMEVLPEWQGRGIGTELMRRIMARLNGFYAVDLVCDEDVRGFYERLGFEPAQAMVIRNHPFQVD